MYDSEMTLQKRPSIRQISPLVIGLVPELVELPSDFMSLIVTIGGALFIIGAVALIWYLRPGADELHNRRRDELPERIEISEADHR